MNAASCKKYFVIETMVLLNATIDREKNQIVLTQMRFEDDGPVLYEIRKKIKYLVRIPGRSEPITCPNAQSCSTVLREHNRDFSKYDVYNLLAENRAVKGRNIIRLRGATIEKL